MGWFAFISDFFTSQSNNLDLSLTDNEVVDSQIDRDEIDRIIFS